MPSSTSQTPNTEVDELVAVSTPQRPIWQRLIGFNLVTAVVLAIVGWLIGYWIGGRIHAPSLDFFADNGQNDISILLGYLLGVIGFMIGMGFANYPVRRMLGHPPTLAEHESEGEGLARYFRLCTDHKVVGLQYVVGIGFFFFIGGLNAMFIRTELLNPTATRSAPTSTSRWSACTGR